MADRITALVGDLVKSRDIAHRVEFDELLLDTMQARSKINPHILSPYTLIGDEIQAVYRRADLIFNDCIAILAAIHPTRMRFSFGIGTLIKPINPQQATEMDGPAFYLARDGINQLKKNERLLNVTGENIPCLELTRHSLFLISHNMKKWNKTRTQTLSMQLEQYNVTEIARSLRLSQQAIYKTISAGDLNTIRALLKESANAINRSL